MLTDLRLEQRRRASELSHRNSYLISFCVTCQATVPVGMNHPHVGRWQVHVVTVPPTSLIIQ